MLRISLSFMTLAVFTSVSPLGLPTAADEPANEITEPTEMAPFVLTLTDASSGMPIAGAEVMPYAMRCLEDPGSHYGWPIRNAGRPPKLATDADGKITIMYPKVFGSAPDWLTASEISLSVQHTSYIPTRLDFNPTDGEATSELSSGEEVAFSGVDDQDQPLEKIGILFAGPGGQAKWQLVDGMMRSRAIPNGRWQAILVALRDDGKHLFSSVLPIRLAEGRRVNIREVKLRPGLQLTGSLSDNVTRPVRNGKVIAWCLPKPEGPVHGGENPSIGWHEETEVRDDGTFEFPSLPRGGKVQIIALADGWLSVDAKDFGHPGMTHGTLIELDELAAESPLHLSLPMEPTGQIQVSIVKPDGSPLEDASVSTWPNQIWELSGSQVLGTCYPTSNLIRHQLGDGPAPDYLRSDPPLSRYYQKTDENGNAVLRDLPILQSESINVSHDDYLMPRQQVGQDRQIQVEIDAEKPTRVTIKMEPKPEAK